MHIIITILLPTIFALDIAHSLSQDFIGTIVHEQYTAPAAADLTETALAKCLEVAVKHHSDYYFPAKKTKLFVFNNNNRK